MQAYNLYPAPHPQTAGRVIDGEAVLLLAETNEIQVLNPVGSRIFELADGQHTLAEIASILTEEYNVDFHQALADVSEFVQQLVDSQVLVLYDQPRTGA
jgi:hypothetical protein